MRYDDYEWYRNRPRFSTGARYSVGEGWAFVAAVMGTTIINIPMETFAAASATVGAGILTVGGAAAASLLMIKGALVITQALYDWATSGPTSSPAMPRSDIENRRHMLEFDDGRCQIALCGQAGAGKSSSLNALRGLDNRHPEAARVGSTETTSEVARYQAHQSIRSTFLFDFPGAGTQNVPMNDYYMNQELCLYDKLLLFHGERFGEVEIDIVKQCIRHGQDFIIIRSKSDDILRNIMNDDDVDLETAKQVHRAKFRDSISKELVKAGCPEDVTKEISGRCVLVNKSDLRLLTSRDATSWPEQPGDYEMDERQFLAYLGKSGTTVNEPIDLETEDISQSGVGRSGADTPLESPEKTSS